MSSVLIYSRRILPLYQPKYINTDPEMKLCPVILLLAIISNHETTATELTRGNYLVNVDDGTLLNVTGTGDLDLSNLGIKEFNTGVFDNLYMKDLNLANNEITQIPKFLFSNLTNLEKLSLANNTIRLRNGLFVGLNNLRVLNLQNAGLLWLWQSSLNGIPKSAIVIVEGNHLRGIYSTTFKPFISWIHNRVSRSKKNIRNYRSVDGAVLQTCITNNGTLKSISISTGEQTKDDDCKEDYTSIPFADLVLRDLKLKKFLSGWWQMGIYQIKSLDLSRNEITEITPELLNELPESVYAVKINENKITMIKKNVIKNLHIKVLELGDNLISTIEDDALSNTHLKTLILSSNHLKNVDFAKTLPTSIVLLNLARNEITKIPENSFTSLQSLRKLFLSQNKISDLAVGTFQGLEELDIIDLSSNNLDNIEPGTFDKLRRLYQILLANNNISEINFPLFKDVPSLWLIDLKNNEIKNITRKTFSGLNKRVKQLDLTSNKINFIEKGSFTNLTLDHLFLGHNKITEESIEKGAFHRTSVRLFMLNDNLMTTINGESFYGIYRVRQLIMTNNEIRSIKQGAAKYLEGLMGLDLSGNPLEVLESGALYGLSLDVGVGIYFAGSLKIIHADAFDEVL